MNKIGLCSLELKPAADSPTKKRESISSRMDSDHSIKDKSSTKQKRKSKYPALPENERLRCGVVLKKLRKIMTIRHEFVVDNRTMYDYKFRIVRSEDKVLVREIQISSGQQFGLNPNLIAGHSIMLKVIVQEQNLVSDFGGDAVRFDEVLKA